MTAQIDRYLSDKEVSEITGRGLQTLRNDRSKGQGLPYVKFSRLCRYKLSDVLQFMEAHKITPAE
jgi:hypothetical protein